MEDIAKFLREKGVEDALACKKGIICCQLFGNRTRSPNRPQLHHAVFSCFSFEFGLQNHILSRSQREERRLTMCNPHVDSIATRLSYVSDSSKRLRLQDNFVVVDKGIFVYTTKDITPRYMIADLDEESAKIKGPMGMCGLL